MLGFGVLVASTLLASAPIYARAMSDLGLASRVREDLSRRAPGKPAPTASEGDAKLVPFAQIEAQSVAMFSEEGRAFLQSVEGRIDRRLGWLTSSTSRAIRGGHFLIAKQGTTPASEAPRAQVQALPGYESKVRVVRGRLPGSTSAGEPIEVAFGAKAAEVSKLAIDEQFDLFEDFDTCERVIPPPDAPPPPPCRPTGMVRFRIPAKFVGVVEPLDVDDPFWGIVSGYFDPAHTIPDAGPTLPAFASEESLFAFGRQHPGYSWSLTWRLRTNTGDLSAADFKRAGEDLRGLSQEMLPQRVWVASALTTTLDKFGRSQNYAQVPLTVLLLEIAGVALFYVLVVATVVVERQAAEIALLRSRGATTLQILLVYLMDGLSIGLSTTLAAPFAAGAATGLLGLTPLFDGVSGGELLPVTLVPMAFVLGGLGAGLSLLALLGPALLASRRGAVVQRRTEARPGAPLLQRYYLDLALAAAAALMLVELHERGSVFTPSATGGVSSDPLLLASPALIIAAGAALLLRFYPLVLRLAVQVFSKVSGATAAMGLWQLARNPGQHTRLALLLMMAVAVGTFAASYSSTTDRSSRDRASYAVGVDWRALSPGTGYFGSDAAEVDATLGKLPGVQKASAVARTSATLAVPGQARTSLQVLAVDPKAARDMLWFREDFADKPLDALISGLSLAGELKGRRLPGDPAFISIWVNTAEARDQINVWARLRDSKGTYALVELGSLDGTGWRELRGSVRSTGGFAPSAPLSVVAIVFTQPANRPNLTNAPIYFDDLAAVDGTGQVTVVESFEGQSQWAARPVSAPRQDEVSVVTDQFRSGRTALKVVLLSGTTGGDRGVYLKDPSAPLPILTSESFVRATGIGVGATGLLAVGGVVVPVTVRDTFRLFPTLDTGDGPAVIFDRQSLAGWIGTWSIFDPLRYDEAWFALQPGDDGLALEAALAAPPFGPVDLFDRRAAIDSVGRDPLLKAGGSGILFMASLALLFLVTVALLFSLWVAVQRRRMQFAVLRTLGLSKIQVFGVLAFEYATVTVVGIGVGVVLGLQVAQRMLSFLEVSENGARVEPPFILQTDWTVLGGSSLAVAGVLVVGLVIAVRVMGRTSDAQALRLE